MPRAAPSLDELTERMRAPQQRAIKTKQTVATAESCTGGLLGAALTAHGGAPALYRGAAIAYDNAAKTVPADVAPDLLHGQAPVPSVVAQALAAGARRRLSADIGLGITG